MSLINSKLQTDLLINIGAGILKIVAVILLTRSSTAVFSPIAFGLFMLIRRYAATLSSLAQGGATVTQYRYMGMLANEKKMPQLISLIIVGIFISISLILLVSVYLIEDLLIESLFPENSPRWVLWLVVAIAVQQLFHFNVVNNLLHERRMILYNLYKIMNGFGLFLLILFLFDNSSVKLVFEFYLIFGGAMLVVGLVYYNLPSILRWHQLPWQKTSWIINETLTYGLPRSPINVLDAALFVVGPWLIRDNIDEVGYLLTIYLFIRTTGIILLPMNQLSMVVSARQLSQTNEEKWEKGVKFLFGIVFIVSTIFVFSIYPWLNTVFQLAITNEQISEGVIQYSILFFCAIPLSIFYGLRGIIEMRWKTPHNLFNLLLANLLGIGSFYLLAPYYGPTIAITIYAMVTFWTLGFLTTFSVRAYLKTMNWAEILVFIGISVTFLVVNLLIRDAITGGGWMVPLQIIIMGSTVIGVLLVWWLGFKPAFLRDLFLAMGWNHTIAKMAKIFN